MRKNTVVEELEDFVDYDGFEDSDDNYRPMCQNSRKSALPLFTYLVLKEFSSDNSHMSQKDIIDKLWGKYEIKVERKAISRCLHLISDEAIGIHVSRNGGAWYDRGW